MKLFGSSSGRAETIVLIDIGAESVAGAYVRYSNGTPALLYTRRLPIEIHKGEAHETAMLRALTILGDALIKEGAPAVSRAVGSGKVDTILVSIDAPWQETSVRTEIVEKKDPFVFTQSLVKTVLERTRVAPSGKLLGNESIIGTILNGYETRKPYGKRAKRAAILVLTSYISEEVAGGILSYVGKLFHTKRVLHIAKCSLRYQAMRAAFPHEPDALILDISNVAISIVLVRRGLFSVVIEVPRKGENDVWVPSVVNEFAEIAKTYPLPRTIFLLAPEHKVVALRNSLDTANFGSLWLSDNPPKIVPVLPSHIVNSVTLSGEAQPDLSLLLMAIYWQRRIAD
jgi:hypothetical protein